MGNKPSLLTGRSGLVCIQQSLRGCLDAIPLDRQVQRRDRILRRCDRFFFLVAKDGDDVESLISPRQRLRAEVGRIVRPDSVRLRHAFLCEVENAFV